MYCIYCTVLYCTVYTGTIYLVQYCTEQYLVLSTEYSAAVFFVCLLFAAVLSLGVNEGETAFVLVATFRAVSTILDVPLSLFVVLLPPPPASNTSRLAGLAFVSRANTMRLSLASLRAVSKGI